MTGRPERVEVAIDAAPGAGGATLGDALAALAALDRSCPGLRFRIVAEQGSIRPHLKPFAEGLQVRELAVPLPRPATRLIDGALSGG